jgi:hypothetical protein
MSILKCTPLLMTLLAVACGGGNTEPQADEPAEDRTVTTATLEPGANLRLLEALVELGAMHLGHLRPQRVAAPGEVAVPIRLVRRAENGADQHLGHLERVLRVTRGLPGSATRSFIGAFAT